LRVLPVSLAVLLSPGCGRIMVTPGDGASQVPSVTVMSIPSPSASVTLAPTPVPCGNLPPRRPVSATASVRLDTPLPGDLDGEPPRTIDSGK
jgi:hypothetical protein